MCAALWGESMLKNCLTRFAAFLFIVMEDSYLKGWADCTGA